MEPVAGGIALIRTGWARFWDDATRYICGGSGSQVVGPGPGVDAARWLSAREIFAAGSDTVAFERTPCQMEVHVHLLVEKGIHIIECLNLEELGSRRGEVEGVYFCRAAFEDSGRDGVADPAGGVDRILAADARRFTRIK